MDYTNPRDAVDAALKEQRLTQAQLAEAIGAHKTTLSRTLGGQLIDRRSLWLKAFEHLGLEVIIRKKK